MIAQILAMVISSWLKGRSKGSLECDARGFFRDLREASRVADQLGRLLAKGVEHLEFLPHVGWVKQLEK